MGSTINLGTGLCKLLYDFNAQARGSGCRSGSGCLDLPGSGCKLFEVQLGSSCLKAGEYQNACMHMREASPREAVEGGYELRG